MKFLASFKMLISNQKKVIFLLNPKCASTSLRKLFEDAFCDAFDFKGHSYELNECQHKLIDKIENYYIYVSVRNPYERLVSRWWTIRDNSKGQLNNLAVIWKDKRGVLSFGEYLKLIKEKYQNAEYHTMCQHRWANDSRINKIIRYESLQKDTALIPHFKHIKKIPKCNISKNFCQDRPKPFMEYYDRELLTIVNQLYSKDFELLGYERVEKA